MKRKVVCYGSCIRPKYWLEMWETFTNTNDIEFEMLMVGHISPDFELPKNIHHVFSKEKPAACVEIGRRLAHASGCKYMLDFTDDYFKFSDNFLDKLVEDVDNAHTDGYEDYLTCAIFHVSSVPPWDIFDTPLIYHNRDPASPQLQTWYFTTTATDKKLGSADKRFYGQYWDVDLMMRNYEMGGASGQQKLLEMTERPPEKDALAKRIRDSKLKNPHLLDDREILDSFWCPIFNGSRDDKNRYFYSPTNPATIRGQKVEPYTDEDLNFLKENNLSSWGEFWLKRHQELINDK